MRLLGGAIGLGGSIACCALLFVLVMVALVVWYWKRQPNMQVSGTAPQPPIQATIEHPTAAGQAPAPAAPVAPPAPVPAPPAPGGAPEPDAAFEPPSAND